MKSLNNKELKAWDKLYAAYYAALCSYANGILKNADVVQDVVQDTLINIWNSGCCFASVKELTWYLYRAVYNNALFWLRTETTHDRLLRKLPVEEMEIPDDEFEHTVQEELIRQVYVHIERLPEERKKILLLSLKGHSGQEIADILNISINTVKTQKKRAFQFLREALKDSVLLFLL